MRRHGLVVLAALALGACPFALGTSARSSVPDGEGRVRAPRQAVAVDALHRPLDELLDLYVRDGFVYYGALKSDRAKLDRYLASLDGPSVAGFQSWSRVRQLALWLNAYNAWVLRTVVDHYPIRGQSSAYPVNSIRQVPGAFDRAQHRVAGRSLTLDGIENTVLPSFNDPRVYFALGRAAVGSGRLRSEAYAETRLDEQLKSVAAEVPANANLLRIDEPARRMNVSPIIGWHETDFINAYAASADARFANRSPIERAVVRFVLPNVLPSEADFLKQNDFQMGYLPFDWRLNDIASRR